MSLFLKSVIFVSKSMASLEEGSLEDGGVQPPLFELPI